MLTMCFTIRRHNPADVLNQKSISLLKTEINLSGHITTLCHPHSKSTDHVDRVIDSIHRGMIDSPSFHIIMRSRYDCGESCGSFALVLEST